MQCPTCYRTCDEQDSFCSGCDYCFVCDKKECECDKDFTDMSTVNELADERNAMRDEVAGLKRKLAEVEGERDALRELNAELLAKLETCRSAIYYEGGNVDELDKFLAMAKNINSHAK